MTAVEGLDVTAQLGLLLAVASRDLLIHLLGITKHGDYGACRPNCLKCSVQIEFDRREAMSVDDPPNWHRVVWCPDPEFAAEIPVLPDEGISVGIDHAPTGTALFRIDVPRPSVRRLIKIVDCLVIYESVARND